MSFASLTPQNNLETQSQLAGLGWMGVMMCPTFRPLYPPYFTKGPTVVEGDYYTPQNTAAGYPSVPCPNSTTDSGFRAEGMFIQRW
jgi:hypothetical protein